MARTPARRAQDGATFYSRVGGSGRRWLAGLLPLLVLAAALTPTGRGVVARATGGLGAGAQDASPAALTASAADQLDAAVRQGGGGYTFTIVQRTALDALPGGPLIDIPDPADRHASLGKTDHYEVAAYVERGAVADAGFWSEVRDGPPAGEAPDFEKATYELGAIVRDGKTYRNDGLGWYPTSSPPAGFCARQVRRKSHKHH